MSRDFWKGEFGTRYTQRNRVDWRARIPFWNGIMSLTGARSVFEVGCNAGWNLSAIQAEHPYVRLRGNDVNMDALKQANAAGLNVGTFGLNGPVELVFTVGVLIHQPPAELALMMSQIVTAATDYVLAVEYEAEVDTEIEYRGHQGKLWKRPFGQYYIDMGLELVETRAVGPDDGFDHCMAWLLKKVSK